MAFNPQIFERPPVCIHLYDFLCHLLVRFLRRHLRHHLFDVGHLLQNAAELGVWQAGKNQRLSFNRRSICQHHGHDHQALEPLVALRHQRHDQSYWPGL